MSSSNPVRRLAYDAYRLRRLTRSSTRPAYLAYREGLAERSETRNIDPRARNMRVLHVLQRAVRKASSMPFWRERFDAAGLRWESEFSFEEYSRIPPLERSEVAAAGVALIDSSVPASQRRKMATGGSSGAPTVTWTGPQEQGWGESAAEYFESVIGVRKGDRLAYLWGHNLDPVARTSPRERAEDWLFNRRWYDCFRLSPDVLRDYHRELQEYRPRVMIAYASALASLAEAIRDQGLEPPKYPSFGFITGAEKLYSAQRELVQSVFGKPVFERYGGRDIGLVGCQLAPAQSLAFAVDWGNVFVEREVPEERASILISKLHADAMPLFRYRTGDVGRFSMPEGKLGPVYEIDEVLGREMQRIWRPDGTWMHGTVVPHLLKDFALHEYQLHQTIDYEVHLLVVPRAGFAPADESLIRRALEMNLPGIVLHIRHVAEIPRTKAGKWLPVISDVGR